jgi:hypothetical protein
MTLKRGHRAANGGGGLSVERIVGGIMLLPLGWTLMKWSVYIACKQSTQGYPAYKRVSGAFPRQNNRLISKLQELLLVGCQLRPIIPHGIGPSFLIS